ncbi:MAG TPA: LLM class flavin-dependent oxidoreductase [Dehalococcoidia bacterium]|nr:LLM class flavin-dependent oxidoreductase [Dehalococcoidia bacterium]
MPQMPALSVVAVAGRRARTLELAQEIEARGFSGIYAPSLSDGVGLCEALALCTRRISFGTAIANIYARHPYDYAGSVALIHELSGGRFRFGIGVSHGPTNEHLGVSTGKPLSDIRAFAAKLREGEPQSGPLPPLVLATLRQRMVELAGEIGQGAVWANAARSHMAASLQHLPTEKRADPEFMIGNMIPTCVSEDREAAARLMRRTLTLYVSLPNYQNYWIEAGYADEMKAIRRAITAGEREKLPGLMSERWLRDVTLFGSTAEVREGLETWYAAGVNTPILVPSSTQGGQMKAFEELFAAFA